MDLSGKTAIITGSARGIGRAIAEKLAEAGANIVVSDITAETGEVTAKEISEKYNVKTIFVEANVTKEEDNVKLIDKAIETFGSLDIMVNNAGITKDGLFMRMSESDFARVVDINLKGAFLGAHAAYLKMMKQRSGTIINMASVIGLTGNLGQANYAASKAGLIGMTKSIAAEAAKRGVRCNAIAPGYIRSEMTDILKEDVKQAILDKVPMGTMGTTEDVANAVLFLSSDLSSYITGKTITVDGGMVMI
ncbi:MAG: 3-oxoacyl-[acyl-carrier-protein] reductase [Fusobacteriaceae bacterium]|nr:3-oxoacyl-[acyl-carrier-protein] reductase [Fusobacteriaceae bacterium]